MRSDLASFVSDAHNAPGRFNVMDYRGATVIADYGHNPDAMRALVQAVERDAGPAPLAVISAAGDRRDQDHREQTQILGAAFDVMALYQDAAQRGRADGDGYRCCEGLARQRTWRGGGDPASLSRAGFALALLGETFCLEAMIRRRGAGASALSASPRLRWPEVQADFSCALVERQLRSRLPVAAKIAQGHRRGAIGGVPASADAACSRCSGRCALPPWAFPFVQHTG